MDRSKLVAAAGWPLLGVVLLAGAGDRNEVRARRLVIEDDQGRERIALEMSGREPTISISDEQGDPRLIASASEGASVLTLKAGKNGNEVKITVGPRIDPDITFQKGRSIRTVNGGP